MKFGPDIHDPLRMKSTDFGDTDCSSEDDIFLFFFLFLN